MAHTKPKSMKVTRTKVRKRITRIEANDAFVFIAPDGKNKLYINIGGKTFYAFSDSPIELEQISQ